MKLLPTTYPAKKLANFLIFKTYTGWQIIEHGEMVDDIPLYKIRDVFIRDVTAKHASSSNT